METGELRVEEPSTDLSLVFFLGVVMVALSPSLLLKQSGLPGMVSIDSCESTTTSGGPAPFWGVASEAGNEKETCNKFIQSEKDSFMTSVNEYPT